MSASRRRSRRQPSRRQPSRRQPSLVARLRVFWVFIAVGLVGAAYGGWFLANRPEFEPATIGVEGNVKVSSAEIRERAAIPADRNVWLLDKSATQQRVEAIPRVRTARVHRTFPNGVTIEISERVPAGCAEGFAGRFLVDETGRVLERGCPPATVPTFALGERLAAAAPGEDLPEAGLVRRLAADARLLAADRLAVVRLGVDRFDSLEVTLRGGPVVRFGDDRTLAAKAGLVDPILRTYGNRARDLAVIDLRVPSTPVVQDRRRSAVGPKG